MSISCTVCGLWYQTESRDRLDICPPCFDQNFAGAQSPERTPTAREALDAYVTAPMTPRQVEAMRRMQARWALEGLGGEDL